MNFEGIHRTPEELERIEALDYFFEKLANGEGPTAEELRVEVLKRVLRNAGANLEPASLVEAKESLTKSKYSKVHPDRRPGLVAVWNHDEEDVVLGYEEWALAMSTKTCPRATFKNKVGKLVPIEGSQDRGLKLMLADLTEMAIGGEMTAENFVRRTDVRVRFGVAYAEMKEAENILGKESEQYLAAKKKYKDMDKADDTRGLYMIPVGSLEKFWKSIRGGELPH
ncbi:hypothetical protein HYU90_00705 [Candidatus Collierbacteria bacterium]|nr:hypothetical protein [Candidatus Collierbacteria bacterium]